MHFLPWFCANISDCGNPIHEGTEESEIHADVSETGGSNSSGNEWYIH